MGSLAFSIVSIIFLFLYMFLCIIFVALLATFILYARKYTALLASHYRSGKAIVIGAITLTTAMEVLAAFCGLIAWIADFGPRDDKIGGVERMFFTMAYSFTRLAQFIWVPGLIIFTAYNAISTKLQKPISSSGELATGSEEQGRVVTFRLILVITGAVAMIALFVDWVVNEGFWLLGASVTSGPVLPQITTVLWHIVQFVAILVSSGLMFYVFVVEERYNRSGYEDSHLMSADTDAASFQQSNAIELYGAVHVILVIFGIFTLIMSMGFLRIRAIVVATDAALVYSFFMTLIYRLGVMGMHTALLVALFVNHNRLKRGLDRAELPQPL